MNEIIRDIKRRIEALKDDCETEIEKRIPDDWMRGYYEGKATAYDMALWIMRDYEEEEKNK